MAFPLDTIIDLWRDVHSAGGGTGTVRTTLPTTSTATLSNVAASATNVTLLAANSVRTGAVFYNDSSSSCMLKFGSTASATSFTIKIDSNSVFLIEASPIYTGRIDGIWTIATGTMRVTEIT